MELIDKLKEISVRIDKQGSTIQTEEATKTAFIMPFISALGYDIFNPAEVVPELNADVGIKRGEKVDYAIMIDNKPIILIEAKSLGTNLDNVHASQLYRYFSVTDARFGVLTNGAIYRFFTDIDESNRMDPKPFLEIDLANINKYSVKALTKFTKPTFNLENILESASVLKYTREIKNKLFREMNEPSDDFVRLLAKGVHSGPLTRNVRAQFKDITKTAFTQFIHDLVNERITSALQTPEEEHKGENETVLERVEEIVTTDEEWEGYYIVRAILSETIDNNRIAIRDRKSYCNILLDDNQNKIIIRLYFNTKQKHIGLFDKQEKDKRGTRLADKVPIESVSDIYHFNDRIKKTAQKYESG